jgi:hypothetical protein
LGTMLLVSLNFTARSYSVLTMYVRKEKAVFKTVKQYAVCKANYEWDTKYCGEDERRQLDIVALCEGKTEETPAEEGTEGSVIERVDISVLSLVRKKGPYIDSQSRY